MPRRRRTPKARTGGPGLTQDQRAFFFNSFGRYGVDGGPVSLLYGGRVVFANPAAAREAWEAHRDELLADFAAERPGKRPWPCEVWDGEREKDDEDPDPDEDIPELRSVTGRGER